MSKITGVHHIAVRAADFDRSLAFYTETLGLPLKATWLLRERRVAFVEIVPGSIVEIFERDPESFSGSPPILHFSFRTDDVSGMTERVRAAGFRVTTEPKDFPIETSAGPMALHLSFVEGPDGEVIEFMASPDL